ncbi:MAG: hypothetical protein ACJ74M_00435 [Gaiellaceae bacterium]|jgi:hypothetical protein
MLTAACLAAIAILVPAVTIAAPVKAHNATFITAVCGGEEISIVTNGNGNGEFTPAHVVGGTAVFIPTAFDLTFSFMPTGGGGPFVDTDTSAKAAPIANTVTCTIPMQTLFSGPEGTATIEGSVTGFFTPR